MRATAAYIDVDANSYNIARINALRRASDIST